VDELKSGDQARSAALIRCWRSLRRRGLGDRHLMLTRKSTVPLLTAARIRSGLVLAPGLVIQPVHGRSWAAVKVHALLVLLAAIFLVSGGAIFTLYASGFLVAPTFLILAYLEARKAPLRITPISFYLVWNSFGLGFSAIFMGSRVAQGEWVDFSVAQIPPDDLATGYVIYLLGSLAVHIGLNYMRPVENSKMGGPAERSSVSFASVAALWTLGMVYLVRSSWFSFLGNIARPMGWLAFGALSLFVLIPRERLGISRWAFGPLLFVGTSGLLFASIRGGSKAFIMFSFIPLIWMLLIRRDVRQWIMPIGIGLLLLYFGVVAPEVEWSRHVQSQEGEIPFTHFITSFGSAPLNGSNMFELYSNQLDDFLSRQFEAVSTGYFVGEVRKNGYQWGDSMSYAMYAFIPRLLWPNKPSVSRGAWFTAYLGAAAREEEATTSTGISATGELYWNFGAAGVAIGMCGIGLFYGLLWRMAGAHPREPLHMVLYVLVSIPGMLDMPEAVTVYAGILSQFLIFGAIFHVMEMGRSRLATGMLLQ
jgi:hypothetical protein